MLAAGQWYRPFNFPLTPLLFLSIPLGLNLRKLSKLYLYLPRPLQSSLILFSPLLQPALEESHYIAGFLLGTPAAVLFLLVHIARSVSYHHHQRLIVHTIQHILHTPTRRTRYLPDKTERAMGAFPAAL